MLYYLLLSLVIAVAIARGSSTVLPRLFFVPPHNWKEKVEKVIDHATPIYLKVGSKRSSYRRRLISASAQPSFYTNFFNNKLKINPVDADNKSQFMSKMNNRDVNDPNRKIIHGFFHPYANNGGGGERVLWQAVQATLLEDEKNIAVIYTELNPEAQPLQILNKVENKFQIGPLDSKRIVFIYLRKFTKFIDGAYWKHFTLVGQLLGSALLSLEAIYELSPDVWIDTIGLPGSYFPIKQCLGIPILAYVHYPIIQPDMFNKLKFRSFSASQLSRFKPGVRDVLELGKLVYWSALYYLYTYLGSLVHITLANGSWTHNHLLNIWSLNSKLRHVVDILYPPCGTENLITDDNAISERSNTFLYIAQFRPEKRHALILNEFNQFLESSRRAKLPIKQIPNIIFLGSCRTPDDTSTLQHLQQMVKDLNLSSHVEFVVDCSYDKILQLLSQVKFGLNAMWNEHFGIGVVEYVSRGVVPVVHASAGPLLDIVFSDTGISSTWFNQLGFFFKASEDADFDASLQNESSDLLAYRVGDDVIEYPSLSQVFEKFYISQPELIDDSSLSSMRSNGSQLMVDKFSNKVFSTKWMHYIQQLSILERQLRDERGNVEKVH